MTNEDNEKVILEWKYNSPDFFEDIARQLIHQYLEFIDKGQ